VSNHLNFAAVLPGDSVAALVVANGLNNFLSLYNTLLVARLVLTWFPNAPPAIVAPLRSVTFACILTKMCQLRINIDSKL